MRDYSVVADGVSSRLPEQRPVVHNMQFCMTFYRTPDFDAERIHVVPHKLAS